MVIVKEKSHRISKKQNFIQGRGYVDNIGYNDLIMKAVTNLAVAGLTEGSKQLLSKMWNKTTQSKINTESKKLLEELIKGSHLPPKAQATNPVTNIIGTDIKRF